MGGAKSTLNAERELEGILINARDVEWVQDEKGQQLPGIVLASGSQGTIYKTQYGGHQVALKVFHAAIFRGISFASILDNYEDSQNKNQQKSENKKTPRRLSLFGYGAKEPEPVGSEFQIPESALTEFYTEVRTLRVLHHPGILTIYGICVRPFTFLCMEYCPVPLSKVLFSSASVSSHVILRWMRQIAYGLIYLHKKGVAHRDLKPENILLTEVDPELADAKLCDFGIAQLDRFHPMRGIGSPLYTAPEVIEQTKSPTCDFKTINWKQADIYSFTVVMWVMMTRRNPITSTHDPALLDFNKMIEVLRELGTWPFMTEMLAQSWTNDATRLPLRIMLKQIINPEYERRWEADHKENHGS